MSIDDLMEKAFAYAWDYSTGNSWLGADERLRTAIKAAIDEAVAKERAACLLAVEAEALADDISEPDGIAYNSAIFDCVHALRARSKP